MGFFVSEDNLILIIKNILGDIYIWLIWEIVAFFEGLGLGMISI